MWENLGFKIEGTGYVPLSELLGENNCAKSINIYSSYYKYYYDYYDYDYYYYFDSKIERG